LDTYTNTRSIILLERSPESMERVLH